MRAGWPFAGLRWSEIVIYPLDASPALYGIRLFCGGVEGECVHAWYLCVSTLIDLN